MRRFLQRLAAFVALQTVIGGGLYAAYRHDQAQRGHYLLEWTAKDELLHRPGLDRVLLVGGSNVPYGINSRLLEALVGRPVVNLGLHAATGRELMLRQAEEGARRGDVVVLLLEYEQLQAEIPRPILLRTLMLNPRALRYVGPPHVSAVLDYGLLTLGDLPKSLVQRFTLPSAATRYGMYSLATFNGRGDAVWHRTAPPPRPLGDLKPPYAGPVPPATVDRLNLFAARCRARGARPCFAFSPVLDRLGEPMRDRLGALGDSLQRSLTMPVLNSPTELLLPESQFFDTPYHLTADGIRVRTTRLAESLGRYLEGGLAGAGFSTTHTMR